MDLNTEQLNPFMNERLDASVVINRNQAGPHSTPVWIVEHNNKIYFSTEKNRKKAKLILKNNKVSISIVKHGDGYVTLEGEASIRRRDEFDQYDQVLESLLSKYINDEAKREQFTKNIKDNSDRILVEFTPQSYYPN